MAFLRITLSLLVILLAAGGAVSIPLHAAVQVASERTLEVNEDILDVAVTLSGKWIYVLTGKGEVLIYSGSGQLHDRISVGPGVDGIRVGPREETLVLTSRREKRIRVVVLDFGERIQSSGSPFKGREDAPVEVIVFSGFQCTHCATLVPVLDQVLEKYKDRVKIVYKHFPLRNQRFGMAAATASVAAHNQGKFWEFHDRLFQNVEQLSYEKIHEIARDLGLDQDRFRKDMQSQETLARIQQDMSDATRAGVAGTPSVFINGKALSDRTLKGFDSLIGRETK